MEAINAEELDQMRGRGEDFVLINVLPEESFRARHIPGSKNVPVEREDFEQRVEELAGGKDRPVVVYCANTECTASPAAARKLEQAGFSRVIDFTGGVQEWEQTDHPLATGGG